MGIYDRDYSREGYQSGSRSGPPINFRLPPLTPIVKNLLIINAAVFFTGIIIKPVGALFYEWFAVDARTVFSAIQPWRLITYQFLHGDLWHLFGNMIGLFFLGSTLERHWGSRRFLIFYLFCGATGGLFYLLLVALGFLPGFIMVGASGAILGMLAACAILFPNIIIFLFLFPVPIRVAAVLFILIAVAGIFTGDNAGGEAAHLAGIAAGAGYVFFGPWRERMKLKSHRGRWESKIARQRALDIEVDRILDKVHKSGIASLTSKERKILQQATRAEQMRDEL